MYFASVGIGVETRPEVDSSAKTNPMQLQQAAAASASKPFPQAKIAVSDECVVMEFRGSDDALVSVHVDNLQAVERLVAIGRWSPYVDKRTGKPKYLRHSQRCGDSVITLYAHDVLFGEQTSDGEIDSGMKVRVKPLDGNYFNLRSANFKKPKPRSPEEILHFLNLLDGGVWDQMMQKAMCAFWDKDKASEALSATVHCVITSLEAGNGTFETDRRFISLVFVILESRIRQIRHWGDKVILDPVEYKQRGGIAEIKNNRSTGKVPTDECDDGSGHLASSLRTDWQDDRPARPRHCPRLDEEDEG